MQRLPWPDPYMTDSTLWFPQPPISTRGLTLGVIAGLSRAYDTCRMQAHDAFGSIKILCLIKMDELWNMLTMKI